MFRTTYNKLFTLIVFLVYGSQLFAYNIYPEPGTFKFSKISQKEGLSHNNIECIFKDADGFVWIGTRNGLCRYDGYNIKVFRSQGDLNSLSGDRILSLNQDKNGDLWIGTYSKGLNRYNKQSGKFSNYNHISNLGERINRISVFNDSTIWICSNNGLAKYLPEKDSFKVFLHDPENPLSLNSDYVSDVIETSRGEVYIATLQNTIQRFERKYGLFTNIDYERSPDLTSNYRKRLLEDNEGVIWIAADVHGLCSFDPSTGVSKIYLQGKNQLNTNTLTGDMALGPDGTIWVCTDGGGINILDTKTDKFDYIINEPSKEGSLSTNHIYTILFDELNAIWVGTFGEGINYFNPLRYKFNSWLYQPGDIQFFSDKSVISVYQDSKKRIWIGTDGFGLYMFDIDGELHEYHYEENNSNSLSTDVITCINEDSDGNILIGTYLGGFISFDTDKSIFTCFEAADGDQSLNSVSVWNIFPDSKGMIWLGLLGNGVDMFDPLNQTFTNYGPNSDRQDKIDFENVMAIMEDTDGDIWFGTEGEGLYVLDNETQRIFRMGSDSLRSITTHGIIRSLYQDSWGYIWIGTEGQGLFRMDKKSNQVMSYTTEMGLPNNIVQSIVEDSQGNLWLGTSNGLSVFNPKTETFRNFIEEDGLSGNEFNQNVMVTLYDGRYIFGTTSGLDVFRPEEIKLNQNLPRVYITKLEVLNSEVIPGQKLNNRIILQKDILYTDAIVLTHKEKIFSLEFVALNYTLPQKCKYSYLLEGFDNEWFNTSSGQRKISYSNLAPGNYIFKVKASNNDGKWGNNIRTLNIKVLPPFYRTWWFRIIVTLLLFSAIYFIYQYRLNLHKNHFEQKQAEQEKKIIQLENEKLESELEKLTFHIINRNRVLIDQKNRLLGLSMKAKESVKVGLQDIIEKLYDDLNDDKDWKYIEPQLDKVYNNFVTKLREGCPALTLSEIKIAAYVRMNLTTKEISEFMHKTPRAVENDRYRLRKKIGLDSNDSLQQYLMNL